MKHIPIRLGPLALLLTVISICVGTLAVLSFSASGADMRLATRYSEAVRTRYLLEEDGQAFLDEMNAAPAGQESITQTFERDGYTLKVVLTAAEGGYEVTEWQINKIWEEDTVIDNLWPGN